MNWKCTWRPRDEAILLLYVARLTLLLTIIVIYILLYAGDSHHCWWHCTTCSIWGYGESWTASRGPLLSCLLWIKPKFMIQYWWIINKLLMMNPGSTLMQTQQLLSWSLHTQWLLTYWILVHRDFFAELCCTVFVNSTSEPKIIKQRQIQLQI